MGEINNFLIFYLSLWAGFSESDAKLIASGYENSVAYNFEEMREQLKEVYGKSVEEDNILIIKVLLSRFGASLHFFCENSCEVAEEIYEAMTAITKVESSFLKYKGLIVRYFQSTFLEGITILAEAAI